MKHVKLEVKNYQMVLASFKRYCYIGDLNGTLATLIENIVARDGVL
jgi:hypothetical protein